MVGKEITNELSGKIIKVKLIVLTTALSQRACIGMRLQWSRFEYLIYVNGRYIHIHKCNHYDIIMAANA